MSFCFALTPYLPLIMVHPCVANIDVHIAGLCRRRPFADHPCCGPFTRPCLPVNMVNSWLTWRRLNIICILLHVQADLLTLILSCIAFVDFSPQAGQTGADTFQIVNMYRTLGVGQYTEELVVVRCCASSSSDFPDAASTLMTAVYLYPTVTINWDGATCTCDLF